VNCGKRSEPDVYVPVDTAPVVDAEFSPAPIVDTEEVGDTAGVAVGVAAGDTGENGDTKGVPTPPHVLPPLAPGRIIVYIFSVTFPYLSVTFITTVLSHMFSGVNTADMSPVDDIVAGICTPFRDIYTTDPGSVCPTSDILSYGV
jgi:hypothetical protein